MMKSNCPLCGHMLPKEQGIRIDEESGCITLDGEGIKATRKQRQILTMLVEKSPRVVSKEIIMDDLYGLLTDKEEPDEKVVGVFICKIRQAIRDTNYEIETIRCKGWLFRRKVLHDDEHQDQRAVG